jgi:tetratricopeptide (TPR) repeat protein
LNAAQFFTGLDDLALAEELLERAETLEPRNTEVKNRLGRLHENAAKRGSPSERTDEARLALTKYEEAFRLLRDRDAQFSRLPSLARAAFEAGDLPRAKRYASRAISDAEVITNWAQGNCIHYGHEILGRIAFAGGELELAAKHLLDAGRTPGSPQLNSFGPSFELANELLEAGDVDSVLHYLELVRRFWQFGGKAIERWEAQLRAGERPRLDRAGALPR